MRDKKTSRIRRGKKTRSRITRDRATRMNIFRTPRHIYAQVIDDLTGRTLVSASTNEKDSDSAAGGNATGAKEVGSRLAERATGAGVTAVVFDRNGYRYHGRVRALPPRCGPRPGPAGAGTGGGAGEARERREELA